MMRDSRRRSPESSRRRKRDQRRDSRENLSFVPPQPMDMNMNMNTNMNQNSNMPPSSNYPDYYPSHPTPTATATTRVRGSETSDRDRGMNRGQDWNPERERGRSQDWQRYQEQERLTRQRAVSDSSGSYSSSSVASSLLDISRHHPTKTRFGGIINTFWRAPSERRVRRRRSGRVKRRRVLYFGNSSSSSVNSDLAYGSGYIPRTKSRELLSRSRNTSGGYLAQDTRDGNRRSTKDYERSTVAGSSRNGGPKRDKTDEEIIAIGRQLSDIARKQNEHDMRNSGKIKASGLAAAAAAVNEVRKKRRDHKTRGIGSSRPHGANSDSSDDSDWEDASDDEGRFSEAESALAYGSVVSQAIRPSQTYGNPAISAATGAAVGVGVASMAGRSGTSSRPAESLPARNSRKSSVVDPRLFGPQNSLRGMINTPCGFGEGQPVADHQQFSKLRRAETEPTYKGPMREVYPVPTSDPNRFEVGATSSVAEPSLPYRSRPAPIPLQQPSPKVPVSSKVYQAEKLEEESKRDATKHPHTRSDETGLSAGTKITGIAAAAAAAVALASERKSKRESRREERRAERKDGFSDTKDFEREADRRERDSKRPAIELAETRDRERESKRRDKDVESELSRKSKRDSYSSKYPDEREHKRHSRHEDDETPRKRREKTVDHYPEVEFSRKSKRSDGDRDRERDSRSEISRSSRRDSRKYDDRDERRREEQAAEKAVETHRSSANAGIDPFQFQVADGALGTSLVSAATAPARPLTPSVVTVDREPNFDDEPPRKAQSDTRLSRKDSFEIERMVEDYKRAARDMPQDRGSQRYDYDEREYEARYSYNDAKHSTAPIAVAAATATAASAVAIGMDRSREYHRDEDCSRNYSERSKDPVQEEADRHYRETIMAQKVAAEEQQSRSASPDKSIVNKYDHSNEASSFTIVTPPEMEKSKSEENRYAVPDADVRIDNKIYPSELSKFQTMNRSFDMFTSRDPSCERERPLLNLVYPTPVPSRQPTPSLSRAGSEVTENSEFTAKEKDKTKDKDRDKDRDKDKDKDKKKKKKKKKDDATDDFAFGSKSDLVKATPSTVSSTAKSVTWGENSTKSFETERPESRSDADVTKDRSDPSDKTRPRLNQASQWGKIAAAIAGSSSEPATEPEVKGSASRKKTSSDVGVGYRDMSARARDDFMDDARSEPPIPGPKPISTTTEKMPGGFADDIEFAATLAAGLKDTGFDPNIVIDDPAYRRRDSPPHSSEPNGDGWNHSSFSDAVTDLTSKQKAISEPGFFSEPIDMIKEDPTTGTGEWAESSKKLSKKEKKKLEKEAKRKSMDANEPLIPQVAETAAFDEPSTESQLSKKEKKKLEKSKRQSMELTDPLPTESSETPLFEDAPESQMSKKEQRKREKETRAEEMVLEKSWNDEDVSRVGDYKPRGIDDAEWEETSQKKSKKSRKSRDFDDDTSSKISTHTDSFDNRSMIRVVERDDELDTPKKSKSKSKRDSVGSEILSQPAAGSEVGERDSPSTPRSSSSKSKRRSGVDFDDYGDDPPDRKREPWEDREVSSVVSESRGDERRRERRSKRSSLYDDDDAKSVASAPGSSRKSKRSSLYDDDDAKSVASAPGSSRKNKRSSPYGDEDLARSSVSLAGSTRRGKDKEPEKSEKRSSGLFATLFKGNNKEDSKKLDKDSFLDNAGTLGAGVGLATAAIVASTSRPNASSEKEIEVFDDGKPRTSRHFEDEFDPEIAPRAIKPAIDPQYGDLLPLPPSEPGSPKTAPEDLPALPDSRPDTPPEERGLKRDILSHRRRRSTQETPAKSPSSTAIPISLRLGQRHGGPPGSPGSYRSPPSGSPVTTPESSRRSARISWDSSREIKPLYLLEHSRQGSAEVIPQIDLPALPPSEPSEPSSRESPAPGFAELDTSGDVVHRGISLDDLADIGLRIDTSLAAAAPAQDIAGSQETTPKATAKPELSFVPLNQEMSEVWTSTEDSPEPVDPMSKTRSSYLLNSAPSSTKSNKTVASVAGLESPPTSTPTKNLAVERSLPDIVEDLTSADEHFSDAVEGPPSDTFEEARDWFDDMKPSDPVTESVRAMEPTEQPILGLSTSTPFDEPEPDEWRNMSAKDKKKAKKARRSKDLSLAGAAAATVAVAAVAAPLFTDEPAKIEDGGEPEPAKKGKKGKKGKKSLSWEDGVEEVTKAEPSVDNSTRTTDEPVPETPPAENDLNDTETVIEADITEQVVEAPATLPTEEKDLLPERLEKISEEAKPEPVLEDAPSAPDLAQDSPAELPESGAWEAPPSKKGKKNKNKKPKDVFVWTAEEAAAAEGSTEPRLGAAIENTPDVDQTISPVAQAEQPTPTKPNIGGDAHGIFTDPTKPAPSIEPEEMWSAPLSKKDKKKKKKSFQADESLPIDKELDIGASAEPTPSAEPEEMWSATLSKKDKKKKKKSLQADEPLPIDKELDIAASAEPSTFADPEEIPSALLPTQEKEKKGLQVDEPLPTDQELDIVAPAEPSLPADLEEMWPDTLSKKNKKKKRQSLQFDEPAPIEKESNIVAPVEPSTSADPEMWFAPLSKKDKKKKKSLQTDEAVPVDKEPEMVTNFEPGKPEDTIEIEPVALSEAAPISLEEASIPLDSELAPFTSKGKKNEKKIGLPAEELFPVEGVELSVTGERRDTEIEANQPVATECSVVDLGVQSKDPPEIGEPTQLPQQSDEQTLGAIDAEFPIVSKDKGKNNRGAQLDDSVLAKNEAEDPVADEDQPLVTEPSSAGESNLPSQEPVEAEEADFAPVLKGKKKKKKKQEQKSIQLQDSSPAAKELDALAVIEDQPAVVEPTISEGPSSAPQEATEAKFTPVSKGNKKKRSVQIEDPLPIQKAVNTSAPINDQSTATVLADQPLLSETSAVEMPSDVSQQPVEAVESEFAPATSKSKKKKKNLQLEDAALSDAPEVTATAEDQLATTESQAGLALDTEAPVVEVGSLPEQAAEPDLSRSYAWDKDADQSNNFEQTANREATGAGEPGDDYFTTLTTGSTKKKKKKKDKRKSVQWEDSMPDPITNPSEPMIPIPDSLEELKATEQETSDKLDQEPPQEQLRSLAAEFSEPLFSQGDAPLAPTQDDATSAEPTQTEPKAAEDAFVEDVCTETAPFKKKDKKNKKNSQANVSDLLEDKTVEDQLVNPALASFAKEENQRFKEEPVIKDMPDTSAQVAQDATEVKVAEDRQEAAAEDEWSVPSTGKTKKKKKSSKSTPISGLEPVFEHITGMAGTTQLTKEPASIDESQSSIGPAAADQAEMAVVQEWHQTTGKKSKKKKRPSLAAESAQEEQTTTETLETSTPAEPVADITTLTADADAEIEVPQKGKKNKKKKKTLDWDADVADTMPESDSKKWDTEHLSADDKADKIEEDRQSSQPEPFAAADESVRSAHADDQDKPAGENPMENQVSESQSSESPVVDAPLESASADNVDPFTPAKLSKKDKKKKKRAAVEDSFQELAPEPPIGIQAKELDAPGEATPAPERYSELTTSAKLDEPTSAGQSDALEANLDDLWGGFNLKQSKKDKKKNKAKHQVPEKADEPNFASTSQPATEVVDDALLKDSAGIVEAPADDSKLTPVVELDQSRDTNPANEEPVGQERAGDGDEWEMGMSKKDRTKKKKAKGMGIEADVSSKSVEETPVSEQLETSKVEDVTGDSWTENVSKKDKKKKNKKAKQGSQYNEFPEQPIPIQDVDIPHHADARPEDEKADPLDLATTAKNTGDTEMIEAVQRDVTSETQEPIVTDLQQHPQTSDDAFVAEEPAPLDIAESSVPSITEDLNISQYSYAPPSGDLGLSVIKDQQADDEWSSPTTAKRGKKSDKIHKSQVESLAWDEPIPNIAEQPAKDKFVPDNNLPEPLPRIADIAIDSNRADKDTLKPAVPTADVAMFGDSVRDLEMQDAPAAGLSPPEESSPADDAQVTEKEKETDLAHDVWESTPQRKLSKKDKKKKKNRPNVTDSLTEKAEKIEAEEATSADPTEPGTLTATTDASAEKPIITDDITAEPEEWLPSKKAKRDKKNATKTALASTALAATAAVLSAVDSLLPSNEEDIASAAAKDTDQPRASSSWADEMEDVAPITLAEPDSSTTIGLQEDHESAFTVSKKFKKGKKGISRDWSTENYPTPESTPAAEPLPAETTEDKMSDTVKEEAAPPIDPESVLDETETPVPIDEGDEWALPIKKKGKKGKRSKPSSGTMTPLEPSPSVEPAASISVREAPDPNAEPIAPFTEHSLVSRLGPDTALAETQGPLNDSTAELAEPTGPGVISTGAEPSTAANIGDNWAVPSKKKGKKGRKSETSRGVVTLMEEPITREQQQFDPAPKTEESQDLDASADVSPAETLPEQTEAPKLAEPEDISQPAERNNDNENWDFSAKKKGKKGKKSSSGSGSMTPTISLDASTELATELPSVVGDVPLVQKETGLSTSVAEIATAPETAVEEDEWALPVKKKRGKGKKIKSIPLSAFDGPSITTSEAEIGSGSAGGPDVSILETENITTEAPGGLHQAHEHETHVQETAREASTLEQNIDNAMQLDTAVDVASKAEFDDPATTALEAILDDRGTVLTSKKGKKEKKRKSSQVVLDSIHHDPVAQAEQEPYPSETRLEEAGNEVWADDFSVPKSKKKGKKVTESLPEPVAEKQPIEQPTDVNADKNITGMDDVWGDDRVPITKDSQGREDILSRDIGESAQIDSAKEKSTTAEVTAAAAVVTGGVALLAEKFGGGKKKKTKGKQKKILDKRQPQEDDLFDDPALWEGADKKGMQEGKDADLHEDFWGGAADEETEIKKHDETLGSTVAGEAREALPTPTSGSLTGSDGGWKETARQGVPLEDEFAESPILGRGERAPSRILPNEPAGLLRRSSKVGEPVGGLLKEKPDAEPAMKNVKSESDFRRSPTRSLSAVREAPEAEAVAAKYNWPTPEMNRDSGFAPDSPNPQRRRSITFQDDQQRDSGVHTDDYGEGKFQSPDVSADRGPPRSPLAAPKLREPEASAATPEPEKTTRKAVKGYGDIASLGGAAAVGGLAAARDAKDTATDTTSPNRRSVSDTAHGAQRPPSSPSPSGRPEPNARRSVSHSVSHSVSNSSLARQRTPEPLKFRPESPGIPGLQGMGRSTPTPPLRRIDKRMSGDLRALRQQRSFSSTPTPAPTASTTSAHVLPPPVANESRVRAKGDDKDMADVYDGFGEGRIGSPRSPTRPHSMRRRQSMQVLELESKVEQLIAENRLLTEARSHAEQNVSQKAAGILSERDAEIEALKQSLQFLQNEVGRLTEVNEGLSSANAELASKDNGRHVDMTRELDEARGAHTTFTQSLQDKDAEIADLRAQLEEAKEQIRQMQRKILDSKAGDSDFLNLKDEDYFDHRCQQLCSHVQQWVLRFSKFSDMRACRLTSEINDEKTIDRLDNAVLDGSDVDTYLRDRVKRRDIFMSMTVNMIWEFVFTRYLFGMDREQRQKLKSLEKLLTDVGPAQAVRQWRAVTLTLLSKRDSFRDQRDLDTEAVVQAIFQTLCKILPPPSNLESQIQSQLRRVMHEAVDLSIEMRTQRAEYMMLPPLQPEYDADGELAATVSFDAAMMNERSGHVSLTNEELEAQKSVVRIVLFPLVVKRGDDNGVGEDKIVVCPAQVIVVHNDRNRRHVTPSSDAGGASLGAPSRISLVTESMGQPEAEYMEGGI